MPNQAWPARPSKLDIDLLPVHGESDQPAGEREEQREDQRAGFVAGPTLKSALVNPFESGLLADFHGPENRHCNFGQQVDEQGVLAEDLERPGPAAQAQQVHPIDQYRQQEQVDPGSAERVGTSPEFLVDRENAAPACRRPG